MLKVYQIHLNDIEYILVNEQGWSASPKTKAYSSAQFGQVDTDTFKYYTHVANVATDDMEQAFESMNLWNDNLVEKVADRCSSMSVGNVIMTEEGDFYVCASFGFEKVVM